MLDAGFTYGGLVAGLAAIGLWLRLAIRALPGFEALLARYEDETEGARAHRTPRFGAAGRLAARTTAVALLFSAIGYAIPD